MNKKISLIILVLFFITSVTAIAEDMIVQRNELSENNQGFLSSPESKMSVLFPMALLLICIVSYMADFGTAGVILGSMGTIVFGYLIKFIALNSSNVIALVIMGGILIFSLKN